MPSSQQSQNGNKRRGGGGRTETKSKKQRPHTSTGTATGKNLDTASVNLTATQRRRTWQDTKRRAKLKCAQSQYCEECDEQERKFAIAEERTRSYGTSSSVLLRKPTPILTGRRRTRSLALLRKWNKTVKGSRRLKRRSIGLMILMINSRMIFS